MPRAETETYYNITEKGERLAGLYRDCGERVIFVVPSGLDKDALLDLISGGGSFFGQRPKICTWGDLYKEVSQISHARPRMITDPPDHTLIIRYILDKFLEEQDKSGNKLPDGVYRRGFSKILGDNIKELLNEDVSPRDLRDRLYMEGDPPEGSPEAILLKLYSKYISYLDSHGAADSAQTAALIRECLADGAAAEALSKITLVFIGFLTFTGSQLKLIKRLKEVTNTVFILPETGLACGHDSVMQIGGDLRERPKWTAKVFELKAADIQLQFDAAARETALWAHGLGAFSALGELNGYGDIGLMVSPAHLLLAEDSLRRYKIPYNVQVRGTVAETIFGELPIAVWRAYSSGWEREKTAFLLAGPLFRTPDLDVSAALSAFPEGSRAWSSFLRGEALKTFRRLEEFCRDLDQGGTPLEIMKIWRDFVAEMAFEERTGSFIDDTPELDEVLKDISSSAKELGMKVEMLEDMDRDIGPAAKVVLKGQEAVDYICGWAGNATLPIRLPQSGSLTVYAGLPPVLTVHRYWIMTDVDYNTWPGRLRESPLLGNESKAKFNRSVRSEDGEMGAHIPELHEEREQKEALFRRLIATSLEGTVVTRSLTDRNGRPLGVSQFLEPLFRTEDRERRWERAGSAENRSSDIIPSGSSYWFLGAEIPLFAEQMERGDFPRRGSGTCTDSPSVSLSSLDEWRECPYRYWCRNNIRLPEHGKRLYDPMKAGTLLHTLWERCWGGYLSCGTSFSVLLRQEWESVSSECYPELRSDPRLGRHADELLKQASAVADLLDRVESSDAVKRRRRTGIEYALPEYETGGVIFKGRADRIDFYDDGFVVIDYKSNRAGDHRKDLQLAAYAAVIKNTTGAVPLGYGWIGHKDASFYGHFRSDVLSDAYLSARSRKKLEAALEEAEKAMKDMAESVNKGDFPANYDSSMCRYCEYIVICRRKEGHFEEAGEENGEGYGDDS